MTRLRVKLCRLIVAALALGAGVVALMCSLWAVTNIHATWTAIDYWLGWFAGLSFIMGFAALFAGCGAVVIFIGDICNDQV